MFKNEVILFPPYDDKIECNYSNFNKIVFQKVSDMIRNPEIREQYERFSCNYHYFYPQLEFLIYEMKYEMLPKNIVIDEALLITREYSNLENDAQVKFNNRLLDNIAKNIYD